MKKILSWLILLILVSTTVYAENCTFDGSTDADWFTADNWTCSTSGAKVPAADDNVLLDGKAVTVTFTTGKTRIPATSGSLGTITSTGSTGQITVNMDDAVCHGASGVCELYATTITAGSKPSTPGIILTAGAQTDHSFDIHANIVAGGNSTSYGVNHAGVGIVNVTGTVTGSNQISGIGFYNTTTGIVNISGNVTGGSSAGAIGYFNKAAGTFTITGLVTGGTVYATAYGVWVETTSGTGTLVGSLVDSVAVAWGGASPDTWTVGNTYYHQTAAGAKLYVSTDPGVTNVKDGTTYIIQGTALEGEMAASGGGGAWGF